MSGFEPKKLSIIRILQVLWEHSDKNHPLKQDDIIEYVEEYGISLDRKTVSSNVSLLCDVGFDIESGHGGTYLNSRDFEESELRLLIDGVLSSRYISSAFSKDLIEKLCTLTSKHFRSHIKNIYSVNEWGKTDNKQLFLNIETVDEAIENNCQVKFNYGKYGLDKKLHKGKDHIVSPYQLVLHNQRYFLMAINEKWGNIGYYRMDRILDMELLKEPRTDIRKIEGFERGIDYKDLSASRPYMFSDKAENVELLVEEWMIDHLIDWFGFGISMSRAEDKIKVRLKVSPNAMEYWAMQYLNSVEVIYPLSLREKIKDNIEKAKEKYK